MRAPRRRLRWAPALGVLLALCAAPAAAQDPGDTGWTVEQFDVRLTVDDDGTLHVEERIEVDFGGLDRHGIYRVIPVRHALPDDRTRYRVIVVDDVQVESSAPADVLEQRPSRIGDQRDLVLRIGDPEVTVRGRQRYTIRYRVRGALNAFDTHDELYWNVTGNGWPVPIRWARAGLRGGQITRVTCYRGPVGSPSLCDDSGVLPGAYPAWASAAELAPGEGLTLVAGFAKGTVAVPPPLYEARWTLARAFTGSPLAWPLAAGVALLTAAGLSRLLWRAGRDRAALGGVSAAGVVSGERPRPMGRLTVVPEFRPPDELRPAQLGLILDERVDPHDVSATIVDLAVRGHLVIEERESTRLLWFSRTDWVLRRTATDTDELAPFERTLLGALFAGGDEVSLAALKGTFAADYRRVCGDLERDAVAKGWFPRRPSHTRTAWLIGGIAATGAAVGLTVLLGMFTTVAVAGLPLVLGGLVLTLAHRFMPARSAAGSRALVRALGFREYIRTAEVGRMEFAEAQRTFVSYLPYAVAFGAVEHWARTFAGLGVTAGGVGGWYVGGHVGGPHGGLDRMSAGLSDFSRAVGGSLPVAPASSGSSGFGGGGSSGGGFGGGGGGSW